MFSFVRHYQIAFQSGCAFYIPTGKERKLLPILTSTGGVSVLDFGHSGRCINMEFLHDNM